MELSGTTEAGVQSGFPLSHENLAGHTTGRRLHCCARQESRSQAEQCGDEGENTGKSLQDATERGALLGASV